MAAAAQFSMVKIKLNCGQSLNYVKVKIFQNIRRYRLILLMGIAKPIALSNFEPQFIS